MLGAVPLTNSNKMENVLNFKWRKGVKEVFPAHPIERLATNAPSTQKSKLDY